jgi:S-adenosylmethionine-diacylglycerol 3-amino-3-carboxypropyl transferase
LERNGTAMREANADTAPVPRTQGVIARAIFRHVHGNYLVYNTCWEDPALDIAAMRLDAASDVLLITSAGCNALDYALEAPAKVNAVDVNFRQNALLELKQAAIRELDHTRFFALFGDGGHPDFPRWYAASLRVQLSPAARTWWDSHTHFLARPSTEASFYHHGTTGVFGRMMVRYFRAAGVHDAIKRLFAAGSLTEQAHIYEHEIRARLWRPALKRLLGGDTVLSLLGVPLAQRLHIERTTGRSVSDFVESVVASVLTEVPARDNYFWRLYLDGRYTRDCCPRYLQPAHFARLQAGLVDRIRTHTCDVTDFLRGYRGTPSHLVLLDHMDWLARERPEALRAEWQAIIEHARTDATLLWRSGGAQVDYVDPLQVSWRGRTRRVGDLLSYDHEQACASHTRDRVRTYGSFYIARLSR